MNSMVSLLLTNILDSFIRSKPSLKWKRSSSFNYELSAVTIIRYVLELLSQANFPNIKNVSVFKLVRIKLVFLFQRSLSSGEESHP